jgi:CHAT domain-containing protein
MAPLAASLHTPRLIIIPHGPLHYLPFAALQNPETQQHLVQTYALTTLPNASTLLFIQQNAERELTTPLIVGNPATGDFDAVASLTTERAGLSPLPFAEKEAQAIAALYGVEPLIGPAATEGVVRTQVAGVDIFHLAAHGFYNPTAPLSSLIALAPDPANPKSTIHNPQSADGWLTVGEVYGLNLKQTGLVVLSACQTQLGELSAGDELVGLTRAFFFAGTPTVVASLWNVDDAATADGAFLHPPAGGSGQSGGAAPGATGDDGRVP